MIALRDWFTYISPLCNGALIPHVEDSVLESCIEWCQRTECDTRAIRLIDILANTPDIELPKASVYVTPHRARTVWVDPCGELCPQTVQQLMCRYKNYLTETTDGATHLKYWISQRPGFVTLIPYPVVDLPASMTVLCSMQPTRNAIEVEDFLFEFYAEQIGWGAAARIHSTPNAPYALPAMAQQYRAMFERAVTMVQHSSDIGFNKPHLRGATVR